MLKEIIENPEVAEHLIRKLISLCSVSIINRDDFVGIDTVLLKDAIDSSNFIYEIQLYWNLYITIGNDFRKHFSKIEFTNLPFAHDHKILNYFIIQIWENFFVCEVTSIINHDLDFPIHIIKAATNREQSFNLMQKVDQILKQKLSETKM